MHKVLEYVNLIHQYSVVMGMDFFQLISEVHPSLDDTKGLPKSISNDTLDLLVKTIQSLEDEKKRRVRKVSDPLFVYHLANSCQIVMCDSAIHLVKPSRSRLRQFVP